MKEVKGKRPYIAVYSLQLHVQVKKDCDPIKMQVIDPVQYLVECFNACLYLNVSMLALNVSMFAFTK